MFYVHFEDVKTKILNFVKNSVFEKCCLLQGFEPTTFRLGATFGRILYRPQIALYTQPGAFKLEGTNCSFSSHLGSNFREWNLVAGILEIFVGDRSGCNKS